MDGVDDISAWLDNKQYLVSASVHESFGYSIAEAMARGIKPLIHHFCGASEIWPEDLLFTTPSDFIKKLLDQEYTTKVRWI